jgi:hypothetical protein
MSVIGIGQRQRVPNGRGTFVPHRWDIRTPCQVLPFGVLGSHLLFAVHLAWVDGRVMNQVHDRQRIVEAFVEVVTTPLVTGFSDGAQAILGVCSDVLGVDGVAMIDHGADDSGVLTAATDAELFDVFSSRHGHGMKGVRECIRGSIAVSREVPREGFVVDPAVKRLSGKGFRHEHFVPMRLGGRPIGALALFDRRSETLDPEDLMLAQGIADSSAAVLDGVRSLADATLVIAQLRHALDSRVFIEQAKGIVAERLNVSVSAAFEHLRRSARTQQRSLTALCEEIIRSRNVIDPLVVQAVRDGRDLS